MRHSPARATVSSGLFALTVVAGIIAIGWGGGMLWGLLFDRGADWVGVLLVGVAAGVWARSSLTLYVWLLGRARRA